MNKQQNLSFLHDELIEMKTHKREFLEKMDAIMPWEHLYELVQPCYYEGAHGNKPCDLERMLIIHLLQNLDDLSIVFFTVPYCKSPFNMVYCKKGNYSAIILCRRCITKMQVGKIYVSDISTSKHVYNNYHFCRGNNNQRKTRVGVIIKGSGTYIYLNKKLNVNEGDIVFVPENIYCYSEWYGSPEIEVVYVCCFMHYDQWQYEPQIICCDQEIGNDLIEIANLLSIDNDYIKELEAYSLFYKLLQKALPQMVLSNISYNTTLQTAIEFITDNWNNDFSITDLAKKCCVSESTLYHMFQKELGQTPVNFLNSIKINNAIKYLESSNYSISTISSLVGFNSENHFRKVFRSVTGTTPSKFKKKS